MSALKVTGWRSARDKIIDRDRVDDPCWICPGTGLVMYYSGSVDVDHIVSKAQFFVRGGKSQEVFQRFATDPENLISTSAAWNRSKNKYSSLERMPPDIAWWDDFLDRYERVLKKYDLKYLPGEKDHIAFFRKIAKKHSKGVNVGRVRAWFGRYFNWVYSPL